MKYNPEIHHRHSIRLNGYDYSKNGYYFVTVVVKNRLLLFGNIENGMMILNNAGHMIDDVWNNIPAHYPGIEIDCHIVMPNHFHGIILLNQKDSDNKLSLSDFVGGIKSYTTNEYIHGVRNSDWAPFQEKLWQRNFFDIIIKEQTQLNG